MSAAVEEERVLALLAEREGDLLSFASELRATPSPNPPGDEGAVAEMLGRALRRFGYRDLEVVAAAETRPNLLARIGKPGGRALVFSGHIDTKPPGNEASWRTPPYRPTIEHGRLYGLGAADMKAALAAMVFTGTALSNRDALDGELRLILTADEEAGAALGAKFLVDQIEDADGILVGEPTGVDRPWEYLAVASRGVACFRVVVEGTQMHSTLTDRLPSVNASVKLAKLLSAFADESKPFVPAGSLWTATVNPGVTLEGGVFYGVCPGEASFGADVRTVPGMTLEGLRAEIADILHVEIADRIFPGGTEGAIWARRGMPVLPALGPGCLTEAYRPNESVGVDEILATCRIYALTAMRFSTE